MKYLGGMLVLAYAGLHAMGLDRFPDDERGALPATVRLAPAGILLWHDGFMGGK
ncbi:MAG: hypothetical protein JNG84_05190 [Archangium sp.]|nr:hypothetical protein [Archangium sp.]